MLTKKEFLKAIETHRFPFESRNAMEYMEAVESTIELYLSAQQLGAKAFKLLYKLECDRTTALSNQLLQQSHEEIKKQANHLNDIKSKYDVITDKDFQTFKEKCLNHYWHFDLANSHEIYDIGSRQEKELLDIVRTKGGIYKQFYDEIKMQKR